MPDLLSHALIGWSLGTLLSWRYDWHRYQYTTAVIVGTLIPDIAKIALLLPSLTVETTIGIPFDWFAIHTLGGVTLLVAVGGALVTSSVRTRTTALLAVGASSHLVADALLRKPDGHSYSVLWPLTPYRPPSPGLYLSTDLWPPIAMGLLAIVIFLAIQVRQKQFQ